MQKKAHNDKILLFIIQMFSEDKIKEKRFWMNLSFLIFLCRGQKGGRDVSMV